MRVRRKLRGDFQYAATAEELYEYIRQIREEGPVDGNRTGVLTEIEIPVPKGPIAEW
jgi:hypothetical protein